MQPDKPIEVPVRIEINQQLCTVLKDRSRGVLPAMLTYLRLFQRKRTHTYRCSSNEGTILRWRIYVRINVDAQGPSFMVDDTILGTEEPLIMLYQSLSASWLNMCSLSWLIFGRLSLLL
jgi:hypothetical protein